VFLPNLDGDFVDVSGRREDGRGGRGRGRGRVAGLLTLVGCRTGRHLKTTVRLCDCHD
jgi:hypothetical protein